MKRNGTMPEKFPGLTAGRLAAGGDLADQDRVVPWPVCPSEVQAASSSSR